MNNSQQQKSIQKIKEISRSLFWQNKITAYLIGSSILMNAIVWIGILLLLKTSQEILIGHYNIFFGIDMFVDITDKNNVWRLFLPPMGGLFFLVISIMMSFFLILQLDKVSIKKELKKTFVSNRALSFMSSRLLLIGSWLLQLILVIYLVSIWFINK